MRMESPRSLSLSLSHSSFSCCILLCHLYFSLQVQAKAGFIFSSLSRHPKVSVVAISSPFSMSKWLSYHPSLFVQCKASTRILIHIITTISWCYLSLLMSYNVNGMRGKSLALSCLVLFLYLTFKFCVIKHFNFQLSMWVLKFSFRHSVTRSFWEADSASLEEWPYPVIAARDDEEEK